MMFNLIRKSFPRLRHSFTSSPTHQLHIFQLNHLLSSFSSLITQKPTSENAKGHSFTVNYFINRCGFAPEKAISASKYLNFNNPDKADAVINLLKNQGFSESQVLLLIKNFPPVLCCDPEKALLPRIEFFLSQGVSKAELPSILAIAPGIFRVNLDKKIIPSFIYLKKLLGSAKETILPIRRCPRMFTYFQNHVLSNIEILRKASIPEAKIRSLMIRFPRTLISCPDRFKEDVEKVRKMGFDPVRSQFLTAVNVVVGVGPASWKKKMEVYQGWGFSEDEVLAAFVKNPWCMSVSDKKIDEIMGFFVNEMGWSPSRLMQSSKLLSCSLNRRIIPRCSVYRVLLSKGLISEKSSLYCALNVTEEKFLEKFVECYEEEAPELSKLYQEKVKLSR